MKVEVEEVPFFKRGYTTSRIQKKACFDAWIEFGSASKAGQYLTRLGYTTKYGNPINSTAVWYGAWNWILENSEEAKPYFDLGYKNATGDELSEERWHQELITKAVTIFCQRESSFERWIDKYDFWKYTEFYEHKFPDLARKYRESQEDVS